MSGIGLWAINDGKPHRITKGQIGLEQYLEDWIENDPDMLERGLTIVGRQLWTQAGPLDLLAIDRIGRWVLIEIKRGRLRREVVAQAIDYASSLDKLDADEIREHCDKYLATKGSETLDSILSERNSSLGDLSDGLKLQIYLVGSGIDPGLDRMVEYLGESANLEIRVVSFSVFESLAEGQVFLAREIHEQTSDPSSRKSGSTSSKAPSEEELFAMADHASIGEIVRVIHAAAVSVNLFPRRYKRSFMFAPPQHKGRCLIYMAVDGSRVKDGRLGIHYYAEVFEEFFGIEHSRVESILGTDELVYVDLEDAKKFANRLRQLFDTSSTEQAD